MYFLLSIIWFIRTTKTVLFYLYLWQLKEYHIGRFLNHFRTYKGKRLILNKIAFSKMVILFPLLWLLLSERYLGRKLFLSVILAAILFFYFIETFLFFKNLFQRILKRPVITKKTVVLLGTGLLVEIVFFIFVVAEAKDVFFLSFWLLLFDILAPLIVSFIVLLFQPATVLLRNQILKKAKIKRAKNKNLVVIGITGSYGKTSTKEFLSVILGQKFKVLKTKEHQNSEIGISRCILDELDSSYDVFVVEMGAYGVGGIKLLADIVKPKIGILTGINEQHIALFGSQVNIIRTKYELIKSLPENGLAVFNGDNKYCSELYRKTGSPKRMYRAEKSAESDIWAENVKVEESRVLFEACTKEGERAGFEANVLGRQSIPNILGSIAAARELGMSLEEISKACLKIKPEQGTMRLLEEKKDPFVIDAAYSSNPDGVIADLDYLKVWTSKKIIIMPCLIELGKMSKGIHRKIGKKIGEVCDLAVITTKEHFNELKEGAIETGMKADSILFSDDLEDIVNKVNIISSPGDVVLLEGRVPEKLIEKLGSS